ncbi:MAG: Rpp14/Pop5 family protein [Candidatus Micrarchaeia archaeon]
MKSVLKEKYRYIRFKFRAARPYSRQEFECFFRQAMLELLGEMYYSECLPKIISYSKTGGVIKVLRDGERNARAALALISRFGSDPVHLQVVFVSGTIHGARGE